jgi:hypothetical protein
MGLDANEEGIVGFGVLVQLARTAGRGRPPTTAASGSSGAEVHGVDRQLGTRGNLLVLVDRVPAERHPAL